MRTLRNELERECELLKEQMASGVCEDYAQYREMVGSYKAGQRMLGILDGAESPPYEAD